MNPVSASELERITEDAKRGILRIPDQVTLGYAFEEYRDHVMRMERAIHKMVKDLEPNI